MEYSKPWFHYIIRLARTECQQLFLLMSVILFSSLLSFQLSQAGQVNEASQGDDIPFLDKSQEKALDDRQENVSTRLISAAEWIDSFFDDGRYYEEENKTRATLSLEFGYTKNDDFEINPRLSVRLQLPKISKKLNLLIKGADDEEYDTDGNPRPPGDTSTDRSQLEAALQYFLIDTENSNLSTSFGGSYDYLYGGLRYRYLQEFGKWQGRFTDRLRWYTDEGWENRADVDFERRFSDVWMFRSITTGTWYESDDGIPHSQIFRVFQVLSREKALLYETGAYFDTDPNYSMVDFQIKLRYRQRFYRDWLAFEIAPQISFPEDHDRDANLGIFFRFDADFGYITSEEMFKRIFSY